MKLNQMRRATELAFLIEEEHGSVNNYAGT